MSPRSASTASAGYKTSKSTRMLHSPEQRTRHFMPYSYGT